MIPKKSGKHVYGANFTSSERRAMNLEIQRQLAEYDKLHSKEMDAMILWQLHVTFGFGPERLKRFYLEFGKSIEALLKRYELDDSDQIWLCTRMLKDYGIDLDEWSKEKERRLMDDA